MKENKYDLDDIIYRDCVVETTYATWCTGSDELCDKIEEFFGIDFAKNMAFNIQYNDENFSIEILKNNISGNAVFNIEGDDFSLENIEIEDGMIVNAEKIIETAIGFIKDELEI